MAISLYDISISSYLQFLGATKGFMARGAAHAQENGIDLATIVDKRLYPDMLPFSFQVISVFHHSLGAINGVRSGVFSPPPAMAGIDYAGLQGLVDQAIEELGAVTRDEVEGFEGKAMKFQMGDFEMPFKTEDFLLSFSLPNFYFHITTAYDILRMEGVPLGKLDFMGAVKVAG
ncbi:MAG: DUF1993 domain-containing protein [Halioglobus sp.]